MFFIVSSKMKTVCIDMVILVSLIQFLIEFSHGLPNSNSSENRNGNHLSYTVTSVTTPAMPIILPPGSSCDTIRCGNNEQCHEYKESVFFCLCVPNAYREYKADKCILKYQWVNYKTELWNSKKLVHIGDTDRSFISYVVARPIYNNGDTVPFEGLIGKEDKTIDPGALISENYTDIQVLLIESGKAKWIPSSNGVVEIEAIKGGKMEYETVYICRVKSEIYFHGGVMQPSKRSCYLPLFYGHHSKYELLVYEY